MSANEFVVANLQRHLSSPDTHVHYHVTGSVTVEPPVAQEEGLIKHVLGWFSVEGDLNRFFYFNTGLSFISTVTFSTLSLRNIARMPAVPEWVSKTLAALIAGLMISPGQFILTHQFTKRMMDRSFEAGGATFAEDIGIIILKYLATIGAGIGTSCSALHLALSTNFFSNRATSWLPTNSIPGALLVAAAFGIINGAFRAVFFNGKRKYTPGNEIQNEYLRKLGQGFALLATALYGYTNAINYVASYVLMVEEIEDEVTRNIVMNILIGAFCSIMLGEIPKNIEVLWNTFRLYKSEPKAESESNPILDMLCSFLRGGFCLLSALSKTASSTLSFGLLVLKTLPRSTIDAVYWALLLLVVLPPTFGYNYVTAGIVKLIETISSEGATPREYLINETRDDSVPRETTVLIEEKREAKQENSYVSGAYRWVCSFWDTKPSPAADLYETIVGKEDEDELSLCRVC